MQRVFKCADIFRNKVPTEASVGRFCQTFLQSGLIDYDYETTLQDNSLFIGDHLIEIVETMDFNIVCSCISALVCEDDIQIEQNIGLLLSLVDRLRELFPQYCYDGVLPEYVVVKCVNFGTGIAGWRLNEVVQFSYVRNYSEAKTKVQLLKFNSDGLVFMIKYENWLRKGGYPYNNNRNLDIVYYS